MADTGDSGATLHAEFNKGVKEYTTNYTNPVTSGQTQDSLRKKSPANSESADIVSKDEFRGDEYDVSR
jgi:hypothetical protein